MDINKMIILVVCMVLLCSCSKSNSWDYDSVLKDAGSYILNCDQGSAAYDRIMLDQLGKSTEGGYTEAYLDNNLLKYVVSAGFGETGRRETSFYYIDDGFIFIRDTNVKYDLPITDENFSDANSKEETKLYFIHKDKLYEIDSANKVIKDSTDKAFKENIDKIEGILKERNSIKTTPDVA